MDKNRLNDLTLKIIEWGKEKGIIDGFGTVQGQMDKTIEELEELIIARLKNHNDEIVDAIGDVYVTLVLGNYLESGVLGVELLKTCFNYYIGCYAYGNTVINTVIEFIQKDLKRCSYYAHSSNIIQLLLKVSARHEVDFLDCVESAYKAISKRKGKMVNGVFVKDGK